MSEYEVVGGGLKLKKNLPKKKDKKKKKKKDKKHDKKRKHEDIEQGGEEQEEQREERNKDGVEIIPVEMPEMTAAERQFLERKRQREVERLQKKASKTHRERIADYNRHLGEK